MFNKSDNKRPKHEFKPKEGERLPDSKGIIALKSICLFILSFGILTLIGSGVVNLCRYLHIYMPSGRGINFIVSYGIAFSYFICAVTALILIMYKYLDFKLSPNDDPSENSPIKITKPFIWVIRVIGLLFIIPYIILEIAFIIAFGAIGILSVAGYPFIGAALMLFGFDICSLTVLIVILKYVYFTNYFNGEEQYNEA